MYLYGNEGRQCVTMDNRHTDSVHHREVCMCVQVTWGRTGTCHDQYLTCRILHRTGDVHTHAHQLPLIELNLYIHWRCPHTHAHQLPPTCAFTSWDWRCPHTHAHQLPLIELNLCIHFVGLEMSTHMHTSSL